PLGPGARIAPGGSFETYTTFVLLYDSDCRERRGLAVRRMMRALAPWVTENPAYRARFKAEVDYARSKGVELGGYSLLSSRSAGPAEDVISAKTGKPGGAYFGQAPCLGSRWADGYFRRILGFLDA